jgi:hypothetical protein
MSFCVEFFAEDRRCSVAMVRALARFSVCAIDARHAERGVWEAPDG